jgi:hypothetical protein
MHPFVAAQIAITFEHEIEQRAAATPRDLAQERRPRRRRTRRLK